MGKKQEGATGYLGRCSVESGAAGGGCSAWGRGAAAVRLAPAREDDEAGSRSFRRPRATRSEAPLGREMAGGGGAACMAGGGHGGRWWRYDLAACGWREQGNAAVRSRRARRRCAGAVRGACAAAQAARRLCACRTEREKDRERFREIFLHFDERVDQNISHSEPTPKFIR